MTASTSNGCPACGSEAVAATHRTREMMFGLREPFDYLECGSCGSLRIADIPADLSRHYGQDYPSMQAVARPGGLRGRLRKLRTRYAIAGRGLIGRLLSLVYPYPSPERRRWMERAAVGPTPRILDVGSGTGEILLDLHDAGFTDIVGVDPFIPGDLHHPEGVTILKRGLDQMEGSFDVVMFHHSLEHVVDPLASLEAAAARLRPGGCCLVRVPTVTGEAWERYGTDWVQLDPPRHLLIPSVTGMEILSRRAGLRLEAVEYDSTELQFTGSELYRRDIPLREGAGHFTPAEIRDFRRKAGELNRAGRGDQAAFYLRKV